MKFFTAGYDTETVRLMVEEATATPTTTQDIWNLARPGALLDKAQIRRGYYSGQKTRRVIAAMLRRRLATQLGRTSPRLLDDSHSIKCKTCQGIAVEWEGRWLCERGHGGTTNER